MIQYNKIMQKVTLSPEAEERIRSELLSAKIAPKLAICPVWKRLGALAACLALAVCCTLLLPHLTQNPIESPPVQHPNQVVTYNTIAELAESLSFPLAIPTFLPEGYQLEAAVNQFGMAKLIYSNETKQLSYFMLEGENPSSGHLEYDTVTETNNIQFYGNDEGYFIAEWSDDTYNYSIHSGVPLTQEIFTKMAQSLSTPK
jgi:hypothetical protein